MPEYQIKTRNDCSPQGKPRVYFCAHPADKVHYWDMIADEILNLYNVAVFCSTFEGEPPSQSDEHFSNLSEAQLFVFPVTANLLSEDSFAMTEIDFARKKHIPILPLMQEKGLEKDFTNTFGNIQFLYNNVEDQSALSYESTQQIHDICYLI